MQKALKNLCSYGGVKESEKDSFFLKSIAE